MAERRAQVTVLGGSSAFVPAFARALAERCADLPALDVRLHGRRQDRTQVVAAVCDSLARRLGAGHGYAAVPDLDAAVSGASVVVNMIRAGGWRGRRHDETFPLRFGLPGDESIGPGGLAAACRGAPVVLEVARAMERLAPEAWFLNLANPLGILQRVLSDHTRVRTFGLCELPAVTLRRALALLEVRPETAESRYVGLNHQGFFVRISRGGVDLLPHIHDAIAQLPGGGWFRVEGEVQRRLGALPVPYLRLYLHREREVLAARARKSSRAEDVAGLSERLFAAYARDPGILPAALDEREMPWFAEAVAPALIGLLGGVPGEVFASIPNRGRLSFLSGEAIIEERCLVDACGPRPAGPPAVPGEIPAPVRELIRKIADYEGRAAYAAVTCTSEDVASALAAHPWRIAPAYLPALAAEVLFDPEVAAAAAG